MEDAAAGHAARARLAPSRQVAGGTLRRLFPLRAQVSAAAFQNPDLLATYLNTQLPAAKRARLLAAIRRRHGAALLDQAVHGLARRFPDLSAQKVLTRAQVVFGALLVAAFALALALAPLRTWLFLVAGLTAAFGVNAMFRTVLALAAPRTGMAVPPWEGALPTYTLLVPLYREAEVLPGLVDGLLDLDYPGLLAQVPQEI